MAYSTKTIFGRRALNLASADDYVDWAIEMLVQGFNSFNLRILAGLNRGSSLFEVADYFLRSIKELNIVEPDRDRAIRGYASEIAQQIVDDQLPAHVAVNMLYRICIATDYDADLMRWYELDGALDSLKYGDYPYAFPEATLDNFDELVKREAASFILEVQTLFAE